MLADGFKNVSDNVALHALKYLEPRDVCNCFSLNRRFRSLLMDPKSSNLVRTCATA